jgi:hypothetical protein
MWTYTYTITLNCANLIIQTKQNYQSKSCVIRGNVRNFCWSNKCIIGHSLSFDMRWINNLCEKDSCVHFRNVDYPTRAEKIKILLQEQGWMEIWKIFLNLCMASFLLSWNTFFSYGNENLIYKHEQGENTAGSFLIDTVGDWTYWRRRMKRRREYWGEEKED